MPYYTGLSRETHRLQLLYAENMPTEQAYGGKYGAIIGPFRTKRAAVWAVKYGNNNPHFQHVRDAERLSKLA